MTDPAVLLRDSFGGVVELTYTPYRPPSQKSPKLFVLLHDALDLPAEKYLRACVDSVFGQGTARDRVQWVQVG